MHVLTDGNADDAKTALKLIDASSSTSDEVARTAVPNGNAKMITFPVAAGVGQNDEVFPRPQRQDMALVHEFSGSCTNTSEGREGRPVVVLRIVALPNKAAGFTVAG